MYFTHWILNRKETLSECWVSLECYLFVGLILGVCALQVAAIHHSSWSLPPLQVAWPPSLSIKFLYLFISTFLAPFPFLLYSCVLLFLFGFYILLLSIICFNSAPLHNHHHIIVFSLCPIKVNLHTYLTSWLSLCPVRIFFGFITIFCLKIKTINKVQSIKCALLKATHIMWYQSMVILCLIVF